MYRSILEQELESKYIGKKSKEKQNKAYPVLVRNSPRADARYLKDNSALRAELDQIKTMLNETKNEMANYRCPTAKELEKAQTNTRSSGKNTDNSGDYTAKPITNRKLNLLPALKVPIQVMRQTQPNLLNQSSIFLPGIGLPSVDSLNKGKTEE
jgi:hypothetical protein